MCRTLRNKSFKAVKTVHNNRDTRGLSSDAFQSLAIDDENQIQDSLSYNKLMGQRRPGTRNGTADRKMNTATGKMFSPRDKNKMDLEKESSLFNDGLTEAMIVQLGRKQQEAQSTSESGDYQSPHNLALMNMMSSNTS